MANYDDFKGSLGHYKFLKTRDGSPTLFSEAYGEACHSEEGAYEETLYNYIQGTELVRQFKSQESLGVFEAGFATGLGLKVSLDSLRKELDSSLFQQKKFKFVTTEIDEALACHTLKILANEGHIGPCDALYGSEEGEPKKVKLIQAPILNPASDMGAPIGVLEVLIGDARVTTPWWLESSYFIPINCFYQDAFSPKRNPELWTTEWFSDLGKLAHKDAILGTYSATKAVWKSLMASGWFVKAVKGHANKKLSTRAYRTGNSAKDVLDWCERSPTPALSDATLS